MQFLTGPSRRQEVGGGVATYRHLLSPQAMTVHNPLRTIAHCDIDAAYAQFEAVRLGIADDVPLICAQWQSIIAVNYPARIYGIKRFTTIDDARKMCPHLFVQHVATYRNGEAEAGYWGEVDPMTHKVSLDPYRRESLKILAIFKEMVPKGEVEKASIDEAFLDLTLMAIDRLLALFPHLATVPEDAPEGLDSPLPPAPPIDWAKAGNIFPINGEIDADVQIAAEEDVKSEDGEEHADKNGDVDTWEDWALCMGAEIMAELREEVWKRLHYTCSAGIAHNKAMSKLCSAWKKPNNQTVLRMSAASAFLRDMDFTDIRFLGGKLGNAIATEYGAKTVGDLLTVPLEEMQNRFGEESIWVYNIIRGIDHTEVKERVSTKSMLASKNVRPHVTSPEQGVHWLGVLGGELHVRLRDAREIAPGLWPKTLVLSHRTGIDPSRSRQIPFPFTRNLSTEYIVKYARKLWDEATQPMKKGNMKLNNIALSFSGLERLEEGQRGIEGFFATAGNKQTVSLPVDDAILLDAISDIPVAAKRPRSKSPSRATPPPPARQVSSGSSAGPSPKKPRLPTLHTGQKRKTALDSFLSKNGESSSAKLSAPSQVKLDRSPPADASISIVGEEVIPIDNDESIWTCPKCQAVFTAPADRPASLPEQKAEHDDYHFALSLQDSSPKPPPRPAATSKKKDKKPDGIKAFFIPKAVKKEPG